MVKNIDKQQITFRQNFKDTREIFIDLKRIDGSGRNF